MEDVAVPNEIVNRSASPYAPLNQISFKNVTSPNAKGQPTPAPVTTFGVVTLPSFNKISAGKLPSAVVTIRNLIRGN
jgi:hypothetical protein